MIRDTVVLGLSALLRVQEPLARWAKAHNRPCDESVYVLRYLIPRINALSYDASLLQILACVEKDAHIYACVLRPRILLLSYIICEYLSPKQQKYLATDLVFFTARHIQQSKRFQRMSAKSKIAMCRVWQRALDQRIRVRVASKATASTAQGWYNRNMQNADMAAYLLSLRRIPSVILWASILNSAQYNKQVWLVEACEKYVLEYLA